jgi:hypothetical protein
VAGLAELGMALGGKREGWGRGNRAGGPRWVSVCVTGSHLVSLL